jgi:hypothetical protein
MAFIFWNELQNAPIKTYEPADFLSIVARVKTTRVAEQDEYLVDSASTVIRKKSRGEYWLRAAQPEVESKIAETEPASNQSKPTTLPVRREGEQYHIYDCSRFLSLQGSLYIIAEGEYATLFHTRTRLEQLYNSEIESGALRQDCFNKRKPGFVVYVGMLYETEIEARRKLTELSKLKSFEKKKLRLVVFNPQHS